MSTHNLCFEQKYEKIRNFYLKIFTVLVVKFSVYFNRPVLVMRNTQIILCICRLFRTCMFVYFSEQNYVTKLELHGCEGLSWLFTVCT